MRSYAQILAIGGLVAGCAGDDVQAIPRITVEDSSIQLEEDGSAELELMAQATVSPIIYEIVTQPTLGKLVGQGNLWEYVGNPDANGEDSFTWKGVVGEGEQQVEAEGVVSVVITSINDEPVGAAIRIGTAEDTPVNGQLPASDVEDDDSLSYLVVSTPSHGELDLDISEGTFVYTPDQDFVGEDFFLWTATDTEGSTTGTVRLDITVGSQNDPPVAEDGSFTLLEDSVLEEQLIADDPDGDAVTWRLITEPNRGVFDLEEESGRFSYRPNRNQVVPDAFQVVASDGIADSEIVTFDLIITPVNDSPTINPTSVEVFEDDVFTDMLLAIDPENQTITYRVDVQAQHGDVILDQQSGVFSYTPNPDYTGVDSFVVRANDGLVDSDASTITVAVINVNDAPTVVPPGLVSTIEEQPVSRTVTATDLESDPLTFAIASPPTNGTVEISEAIGTFVYVPEPNFEGDDSFEITASDGMDVSAPATVRIFVEDVNDAPVTDLVELPVVANQTAEVMLNAVDPEGDPVFYYVTIPPVNGSVSLDALTGRLIYTPDMGFNGFDSVEYEATDNQLASKGFVSISVSEDRDLDDIGDVGDNCPDVPNTDQSDVNDNGRGDVCDCVSEAFSATLDTELFAFEQAVSLVSSPVFAGSHAIRFNGTGAALETTPQPGCDDYVFDFQLATGAAPPEVDDAFRLLVSTDGGPFELVYEQFGTDNEESFAPVFGLTDAANVDGTEVVFRFEVLADDLGDQFVLDELFLGCDTDSDLLPDCIEATLPGYDLEDPDPDGDLVIDSEERAQRSDPNFPDTDFDGFDDLEDNCPTVFNDVVDSDGNQLDSNNNGFGDACDKSISDDFEAGVADPTQWIGITGDAGPSMDQANNSMWSIRFSNGGGGQLEALPIDLIQCSEVAWDFRLAQGTDWPSSNDFFRLQVFDGTQWVNLYERMGTSQFLPFFPVIGSTTNPAVLELDVRLRFASSDTGSIQGDDDWFLDDVVIGCDDDGDDLPSFKEIRVYGTDPDLADTDGDGVDDGTEIVNGTDPLRPPPVALPVFEDFDTGAADTQVWTSPTGVGDFSTNFASNGMFSLRLGDDGGEIETFDLDTLGCTNVAWDFRLRGGDAPNAPDGSDLIDIDVFDGFNWVNLQRIDGSTTYNFDPILFTSADPAFATGVGAALRFRAPDDGNAADSGEWYIDDIVIDCDEDQDLIPDVLESALRYGTDPNVFDTDGDGVGDGQEILDGTNPVGGFVTGADIEPNNTRTDADLNPYVVGNQFDVVGDVLTPGDIDVYRIDTTSAADWRIQVLDGPTSTCLSLALDSYLTLYDSAGTIIAQDEDGLYFNGFCSEISIAAGDPVANLPAGIYYVEVRETPFYYSYPFDYSLRIDLTPVLPPPPPPVP